MSQDDSAVAGTITPIAAYPKEQELSNRIEALVAEYNGEISNVAVIGVLHLLILRIAKG